VLSLLVGSIAASADGYPQSLQGIMISEKSRERVSSSPESGEFLGWYDPRILGGQFLDVGLGLRYLISLLHIVFL